MSSKQGLGSDLPLGSGSDSSPPSEKGGGSSSKGGGSKDTSQAQLGTSAPDVTVGPSTTVAGSSAAAASRKALGRPKGSKNKPKGPSASILEAPGPGIKPVPIESQLSREVVEVDNAVDPLPPISVAAPDPPTRRKRFDFMRIGA